MKQYKTLPVFEKNIGLSAVYYGHLADRLNAITDMWLSFRLP